MSNLHNCSKCNIQPNSLIRIETNGHQYCYYVCPSCGRKTRDILLSTPDFKEDIRFLLAVEWNEINNTD